MKILVIEDDREAASYLVKALGEAGHVTDQRADGETGFAMATRSGLRRAGRRPHAAAPRRPLAHRGAARRGRQRRPVLILSALGEVDDRVTGLRAGGDDYLAKPYAFTELLARVEVLGAAQRAAGGGDRLPRSAISSSTGCRARSSAPARRSSCSRANSACSNI